MAEVEEEEKSKEEMEAEITCAMKRRLADFKAKADSLTLEGVRRALEKELGLKTFTLDVHKKFIKQCMEKYFYGPTETNIPVTTNDNPEDATQPGLGNGQQKRIDPADAAAINGDKEASVNEDQRAEEEAQKTDDVQQKTSLDEDTIMEAMKKRALYLKENSENITISGVRRLLEEDLKIEKNSLDAYKGFIRKLLDEILYSEDAEPAVDVTKKNLNKQSSTAKSNEMNEASKGSSIDSEASNDNLSSEAHNSDDEDEEHEEKKTKSKKRNARETKMNTTKVLKKQKTSSKKIKSSTYAKKKTVETDSDRRSSDTDERENPSKNDSSDSSADETSKKKIDKPAPLLYGKKVEHLKSVIKSCGLTVPPLVYKRVKQAPESKRQVLLIKELEGILEKEGLSTNPSEKEIKAVRKKKERAKELEGIDMSNIVSSSRRRTTSSFIPPKPTPPVESDEEDEEDEENEEDSEDENSDNEVSNEESEDEGEESD